MFGIGLGSFKIKKLKKIFKKFLAAILVLVVLVWALHVQIVWATFNDAKFGWGDPAWSPMKYPVFSPALPWGNGKLSGWQWFECLPSDIWEEARANYFFPPKNYPTIFASWWSDTYTKLFDAGNPNWEYSIYDAVAPASYNPNVRKKWDELCLNYMYSYLVFSNVIWAFETRHDKLGTTIPVIPDLAPPPPSHVVIASHKPIEKAIYNEDVKVSVSIDYAWEWVRPNVKLYWRKNSFSESDPWYEAPYSDGCGIPDSEWRCNYPNNWWNQVYMLPLLDGDYSDDMKEDWKFNLYSASIPAQDSLFEDYQYYIEVDVALWEKIYFPDQSFNAWDWISSIPGYKYNFYDFGLNNSITWSVLWRRDSAIKWKKISPEMIWDDKRIAWYIIHWSPIWHLKWANAFRWKEWKVFKYSVGGVEREYNSTVNNFELKEWPNSDSWVTVYQDPFAHWWMAYSLIPDNELHWMEEMKNYREIRISWNLTQDFFLHDYDPNLIDDDDIVALAPNVRKKFSYCPDVNQPYIWAETIECQNNAYDSCVNDGVVECGESDEQCKNQVRDSCRSQSYDNCMEVRNCKPEQIVYLEWEYNTETNIMNLFEWGAIYPKMASWFMPYSKMIYDQWKRFPRFDYAGINAIPDYVSEVGSAGPRSAAWITSSNSRFKSRPSMWAVSAYYADKPCNIYFHWFGSKKQYVFNDENGKKVTFYSNATWDKACVKAKVVFDHGLWDADWTIDTTAPIELHWDFTIIELEDTDVSWNKIVIYPAREKKKWEDRNTKTQSTDTLIWQDNLAKLKWSFSNFIDWGESLSAIQNISVEIFDDDEDHIWTVTTANNNGLQYFWNAAKTKVASDIVTSIWDVIDLWFSIMSWWANVAVKVMTSIWAINTTLAMNSCLKKPDWLWCALIPFNLEKMAAAKSASNAIKASIDNTLSARRVVSKNVRKWKSYAWFWSKALKDAWKDWIKVSDDLVMFPKKIARNLDDVISQNLIKKLDTSKLPEELSGDVLELVYDMSIRRYWEIDLDIVSNAIKNKGVLAEDIIKKIGVVWLWKLIDESWKKWDELIDLLADLKIDFWFTRVNKDNIKKVVFGKFDNVENQLDVLKWNFLFKDFDNYHNRAKSFFDDLIPSPHCITAMVSSKLNDKTDSLLNITKLDMSSSSCKLDNMVSLPVAIASRKGKINEVSINTLSKLLKNTDLELEDYMKIVKSEAKNNGLKLTKAIRDQFELSISGHVFKRKKAEELIDSHPNNEELFVHLFWVKPKGKVNVKREGWVVVIDPEKQEDWAVVWFNGNQKLGLKDWEATWEMIGSLNKHNWCAFEINGVFVASQNIEGMKWSLKKSNDYFKKNTPFEEMYDYVKWHEIIHYYQDQIFRKPKDWIKETTVRGVYPDATNHIDQFGYYLWEKVSIMVDGKSVIGRINGADGAGKMFILHKGKKIEKTIDELNTLNTMTKNKKIENVVEQYIKHNYERAYGTNIKWELLDYLIDGSSLQKIKWHLNSKKSPYDFYNSHFLNPTNNIQNDLFKVAQFKNHSQHLRDNPWIVDDIAKKVMFTDHHKSVSDGLQIFGHLTELGWSRKQIYAEFLNTPLASWRKQIKSSGVEIPPYVDEVIKDYDNSILYEIPKFIWL